MRNAIAVAILSGIGLVTFTQDAYAYLDPGTASIVLQGLIGGIAAAAAVVTIYWQRVKYFFSRMLGRCDDGGLTAADANDL